MADETLDERALRLLDLDPATHVVVGVPKFSKWQSGKDGRWMESVKVSVAERDPAVDLDSLVKRLHARRPLRAVPEASGEGAAFVFAMSDAQLGKPDGDGVEGTVARIKGAVDEAVLRVKRLRRDRILDTLVIGDVGDMTEGVCGFYPKQQFSVQLDHRQQAALARELWSYAVKHLAPLFSDVRLVAVPSNHSEARQNGKAITRTSDDSGLANAGLVYEASRLAGFEQVSLCLPDGDEPWVVLDDLGLAFFHGHLSGTPDLSKWWAQQCLGGQPTSRASILVSGHWHHLKINESSGRTWVQCPAAEGGSDWWRDRTGQVSPPGVLSFVTDGRTVSEMQVLGRRVVDEAAA